MAEERYIIAHDVGTGGSKAALCDLNGNITASRFRTYGTDYPREHWAEQDPDGWWAAITATTREVMEETGTSPEKVAGVVFSTQMIGVLPVDRQGMPLRPAIIWLDARASEQADRIVRRLTKTLLLAVAGGLPTGKDVIPKLMWLRQHEPGVYEETYKILEVNSYLVNRSCGEFVYDYSAASGTGMFNFKKKDWDQFLFKLFRLDPGKMPRVAPSSEKVGELKVGPAEEMGLVPGTAVFCGTGDVPSATVGSGALLDGQGHVYIGSSGWIAVTMPKALNDGRKGIVSIASADPTKFLLLAEMESAGACFRWFAENLAPKEIMGDASPDLYDELNRIAAESEPGSNGLIFCPWMYGERSPIPDHTVRGGFINLSLDHHRGDVARSVFEGVALHGRWMLEGVRNLGFNDVVLRAIGGGAKSDLWLQTYADALGVVIERVEEPQESGARGAALIAALGLGAHSSFTSLRDAVKVSGSFSPRPDYRAVYDERFETFKESYASLRKLYARVNAG
ncbi:MAG: FGGY-family carbohydrate kinase [Actinobacteria bacterium]|nr:FGGY-family carbohydrate kinase [Actinomycetota bacterium]MBU1942563.1 FGGY-family carbohydrate kinase [Actinomycetota bacterium]MBU2687282.1 FGGY-family carbohydrate kinase [Actinomycetota bacterium]